MGDTTTCVEGEGAADVGRNAGLPSSKPERGSSAPEGGEKRNSAPEGVVRLSVRGLKVVLPAYDIAVTISGDARKFMVSGLPSFRPRKLRLYDEKIALLSPFEIPSVRFHWPMQGPQAFASTIPPASSNEDRVWSRSRVARICSLPGVTKKSVAGLRPAAEACLTISSARVMSWYELLVQLPISPAETDSGH